MLGAAPGAPTAALPTAAATGWSRTRGRHAGAEPGAVRARAGQPQFAGAGSRCVLLTVDAAGVQGRFEAVASAEEADGLDRSIQGRAAGSDATFVLPDGPVLALTLGPGPDLCVLTLAEAEEGSVTLTFRAAPEAVATPF
jgi:hypothetical protein